MSIPWNLLVLPLLGGYLFCSKYVLTRGGFEQLSREHLIFRALAWGFIFLVISRILILVIDSIIPSIGELKNSIAPIPYLGTSIGALLIGYTAPYIVNYVVGLYRSLQLITQLDELTSASPTLSEQLSLIRKPEAFKDALGLVTYMEHIESRNAFVRQGNRLYGELLTFQLEVQMVSVTLRDSGKVFAGYLEYVPPDSNDPNAHLELLVVGSGYRDDKQLLHITNWYLEALQFVRLPEETRQKQLKTNPEQAWLENVSHDDFKRFFF